jgi:hypothetical protein
MKEPKCDYIVIHSGGVSYTYTAGEDYVDWRSVAHAVVAFCNEQLLASPRIKFRRLDLR